MSSERLRVMRLRAKSIDEAKAQSFSKSDLLESGSYSELLSQAGIKLNSMIWIGFAGGLSVFLGLLFAYSLALTSGAVAGLACAYYILFLYPQARARSRRAKALPQLPLLVEALRLYSEDEIELAKDELPESLLKTELEDVLLQTKDLALPLLRQRIQGPEIYSLVLTFEMFPAIFRDKALERLSRKLMQASEEFRSRYIARAGLRQTFVASATVVLLVPLVVYLTNPGFFAQALSSPRLNSLMQLIIIIQALSLLVFKRQAMQRP